MKIFWSWQSDTPGKIGRFLVRDALRDAIDQLKQSPDLAEPTRDLDVDHDIKDVSGSPDLVRTILSKIEMSDLIVADVTVVGESFDGPTRSKKLINSNVAIELGYAFHALTDQRVVLVFNKYYGKHEDLPFNLRHKGGAVTFDLPPSAQPELIKAQRDVLRGQFVRALTPFVQAKKSPLAIPFEETKTTFNKAVYFEAGESIAPET